MQEELRYEIKVEIFKEQLESMTAQDEFIIPQGLPSLGLWFPTREVDLILYSAVLASSFERMIARRSWLERHGPVVYSRTPPYIRQVIFAKNKPLDNIKMEVTT